MEHARDPHRSKQLDHAHRLRGHRHYKAPETDPKRLLPSARDHINDALQDSEPAATLEARVDNELDVLSNLGITDERSVRALYAARTDAVRQLLMIATGTATVDGHTYDLTRLPEFRDGYDASQVVAAYLRIVHGSPRGEMDLQLADIFGLGVDVIVEDAYVSPVNLIAERTTIAPTLSRQRRLRDDDQIGLDGEQVIIGTQKHRTSLRSSFVGASVPSGNDSEHAAEHAYEQATKY